MLEVVELALFRALQEGLTNAHRHSASPTVEVKFERLPECAVLEIRDFGRAVFPQQSWTVFSVPEPARE